MTERTTPVPLSEVKKETYLLAIIIFILAGYFISGFFTIILFANGGELVESLITGLKIGFAFDLLFLSARVGLNYILYGSIFVKAGNDY